MPASRRSTVMAVNHAARRSKTIHFDVIRLRTTCKAARAGRPSRIKKTLPSFDFEHEMIREAQRATPPAAGIR
jgi:hypothetical protein